MGYWQKESEFGKKVGCFKASLGSLGLNEFFKIRMSMSMLGDRYIRMNDHSRTPAYVKCLN